MASKMAATPREETVEEFLARGGRIERIEATLMAAFCSAASARTGSASSPPFQPIPRLKRRSGGCHEIEGTAGCPLVFAVPPR
jgi:hypothetical protein